MALGRCLGAVEEIFLLNILRQAGEEGLDQLIRYLQCLEEDLIREAL